MNTSILENMTNQYLTIGTGTIGLNWLLVAVLLIISANIVWGYRTGFVRVVYSFGKWILIFAFMTAAAPQVTTFLLENTQVYDHMHEIILDRLENNDADNNNINNDDNYKNNEELDNNRVNNTRDNYVNNKTNDDKLNDSNTYIDNSNNYDFKLSSILEGAGINLPDVLVDKSDLGGEILEATGVYDYIAEKLTCLAIDALAYVITLIAAFLLFAAIGKTLNIIDKIPGVRTVNRTAGIMAGGIKGLLIIWIFFAIVAIGAATGWGIFLTSFIYENPLLYCIYESNPLLRILSMYSVTF